MYHGGVFNGLRHYRVRAHYAILSYLRFGKFQINMFYDGQTPSCRKCNCLGHKAAECINTVCFNCDGLGHVSKECIRPMYCCICKSGQHLACTCPFSWHHEWHARTTKERPAEQTEDGEGDGDVNETENTGEELPSQEQTEQMEQMEYSIIDHSDLDLNDEETAEEDANEIDVNNMQEDENLSDNVPPPSEDSVADFTPPPLSTPDLSVPEDTDDETPASARFDPTEASVTTEKSTVNSDGYIVDNVKRAQGKCVQEQSVSNLYAQPSLTSSEKS